MKLSNPAALSAAAKGDFANAMVASMPGGIEAQEAAGQAMLCASEQLPKEINGATREQLEAIGFKFGADVDELFVTAHLPPGWKKIATGHSMHSDIFDEKGRRRANIFYKAAFYDRRAHMGVTARFHISGYIEDPSDKNKDLVQVIDMETPIHTLGSYERTSAGYRQADVMKAEAETWLTERFPQWRDKFAHWD